MKKRVKWFIPKQEALRQIKRIEEVFDWAKVRNAMVALDWEWARCNGTPHIKTMQKCARMLLLESAKRDVKIGTGGFYAAVSRSGYLRLRFEVDEVDLEEIEYGTPTHTIKMIKEICK